jgi:hypothetical protein
MFEAAGQVFFRRLHAAAVARLGATAPCTLALAAAAEAPTAERVAAAQTALDGLPAAEMAAVMAEAHRSLRSDPQAWLEVWPGPPGARN